MATRYVRVPESWRRVRELQHRCRAAGAGKARPKAVGTWRIEPERGLAPLAVGHPVCDARVNPSVTNGIVIRPGVRGRGAPFEGLSRRRRVSGAQVRQREIVEDGVGIGSSADAARDVQCFLERLDRGRERSRTAAAADACFALEEWRRQPRDRHPARSCIQLLLRRNAACIRSRSPHCQAISAILIQSVATPATEFTAAASAAARW